MSRDITITVGGSARDDAAAFLDSIRRSEAGENVCRRILSFENWEALAAIMTPARFSLMKHLAAHPTRSVRALSQALGRDYRRVHDDVVALADAGLVERGDDRSVRVAVDRIKVEVQFSAAAEAA